MSLRLSDEVWSDGVNVFLRVAVTRNVTVYVPLPAAQQQEGRAAPAPFPLLGQGWKRRICAWETVGQMPFGITCFSFTAVLRIAYKHATFKLPLPSNFPV